MLSLNATTIRFVLSNLYVVLCYYKEQNFHDVKGKSFIRKLCCSDYFIIDIDTPVRYIYTYTKSNLKFKPLSLKSFFSFLSRFIYYNFTNSNTMLRFKQRNEIKSATQTNYIFTTLSKWIICVRTGYSYVLIFYNFIIFFLRQKDIFSYNNGFKNSLNNITHWRIISFHIPFDDNFVENASF